MFTSTKNVIAYKTFLYVVLCTKMEQQLDNYEETIIKCTKQKKLFTNKFIITIPVVSVVLFVVFKGFI